MRSNPTKSFTTILTATLILTTISSIAFTMQGLMVNFLDSDENGQDNTPPGSPTTSEGNDPYSSPTFQAFDILENATNSLNHQDLAADGLSSFNISTPAGWSGGTANMTLETFSKEQVIIDPTFEQPLGDTWEDDSDANGAGSITQYFALENLTSHYARTNFDSDIVFLGDAFKEGDYALWEQSGSIENTNGFEIARGELIQPRDQTIENFGNFTSNPGFIQDYQTPYGGSYRQGDDMNLYHDNATRSLVVDINPSIGIAGGNPSAAWWTLIDIPYEIDHAELSVSWSIDPASTFEAGDEYQVISRINNKHIDGSTWISKNDSLPYNGSETALIVYDNGNFLDHGRITRTYNITTHVDKFVGLNKIDIGAWAKNPTHQGDEDRLLLRVETMEIRFNTSDTHEVGTIEFDYKCIDNLNAYVNPIDGGTGTAFMLNYFSLYMLVENELSEEYWIRLLPFLDMVVNTSSQGAVPWNHFTYSIPQEFETFLASDEIAFSIGILFERNYKIPIDLDIELDNVFLNLNYKHPDVNHTELEMRIDGGSWQRLYTNEPDIDTSGWLGGQDHA
ncbi:hypothetical protein GF325_03265, partial [Candidatus Bathyarchaeota archaeon]|nr:hypothetical protein [Candidatus Bathyarchaeota archaeon]